MPDDAGRMFQRFVIDGATAELAPPGGLFRRGAKAATGHVLNFAQGGIQFLCGEQTELKAQDRVEATIHLRNRRNWIKTEMEVRWCRKVPNRPFKRAGLRFCNLSAEQLRFLQQAEREYLATQEGELKGQTGRMLETYRLPPYEPPPGEAGRNVAAAIEAERARFGGEAKQVVRPVALLELISMLDRFEVTDDLVLALLEAAEQGISVESLFGLEEDPEEARPSRRRREVVEEKPREDAKPMPVYRLDGKTVLHFNEDDLPVSPPVDHLFYSRLAGETCFACEIQDERMTQPGGVSFRLGDVVVFAKSQKIESGSFIFVKVKGGADEFSQVFFGKDDQVRLRPLNGNYPERTVRRADCRVVYKVIARMERMA